MQSVGPSSASTGLGPQFGRDWRQLRQRARWKTEFRQLACSRCYSQLDKRRSLLRGRLRMTASLAASRLHHAHGGWMLEFLLSLFISTPAAQGRDLPTPPCDTRSDFKGTTHSRLGRLKGAASMLQLLRCSGAFMTFADR